MKKILMILPIMAGVIFLGGCGNNDQTSSTTEIDKGNKTDAIVGSLKEMVGAGKQMECVIAQDGVETKTYIEGKKYKSVTVSAGMTMTSLFDGETFYSWNARTKAGTKMTMTCMEEIGKNIPKAAGEDSDFASTDKLIEKEMKNNNCQEATEKIDFTLPTDIDFVDQCLMLQNITKNLPAGELPAGFKMPTE